MIDSLIEAMALIVVAGMASVVAVHYGLILWDWWRRR